MRRFPIAEGPTLRRLTAAAAVAVAGIAAPTGAAAAPQAAVPPSKDRVPPQPTTTYLQYENGVPRVVTNGPALSPPKSALRKALDQAAWDPAERGPLLVVEPGEKPRPFGAHPTEPDLVAAADGRLRLPDIAEKFGRRMVALHGITVCAPATMVVFNTHPGKPNIDALVRESGGFDSLAATLTEDQWKSLASDGGLGIGDLDQSQRKLFLALLPDPFRVRTGGIRMSGGSTFIPADFGKEVVTLRGADRERVRLRMNLVAIYAALYDGAERQPSGYDVTTRGMAASSLEVEWPAAAEADERSLGLRFGVPLRQEVPSRLKPQQIDFEAPSLNPTVSLEGATTVQDLVDRIRKATRVEVYVDGRMGAKSLWVRAGQTDTVRAGELLKALCWAVTGAVRHVGPGVFILTDDVEGYGTRLSRLFEWSSTNWDRYERAQRKIESDIRRKNPLQYLTFASGDTDAPADDVHKQVVATWKDLEAVDRGIDVPVSSLPSEVQAAVRALVSMRGEPRTIQGKTYTLSASHVRVREGTRLSYLVPGIGAVPAGSGADRIQPLVADLNEMVSRASDLPKFADTIDAPVGSAHGPVVIVAPKTEDEARMAVAAARRHGLRQVWIAVPRPRDPSDAAFAAATAAGRKLLAAAITEAGSARPSPDVVCLAPVLSLEAGPDERKAAAPEDALAVEDPPLAPEIDVNLRGETALAAARRWYAAVAEGTAHRPVDTYYFERKRDWLNAAAPRVAARATGRIADLAATPGLAGLVLVDAAAPGYSDTSGLSGLPYAMGWSGLELGYTIARRAAFVQSHGYDPIDLLGTSDFGVDNALPYLSTPLPTGRGAQEFDQFSDAAARRDWSQDRFAVTKRLLADVYARVAPRKAADGGPLPLYLPAGGWFCRWTKQDSLPAMRFAESKRSSSSAIYGTWVPVHAPGEAAQDLFTVGYDPMPRDPDIAPRPEDSLPPAVRFAHRVNQETYLQDVVVTETVLDLSRIPVADALAILDGAMPAASGAGVAVKTADR